MTITDHRAIRAPSGSEAPAAAGAAVALVCCLVVAVAGWRGGDYPAQLLRVETYRGAGLGVWNNQWFAGHHTPGYSVLFPPLAAWVGPLVLGSASIVAAAAALGALVAGRRRAVVAAVAFAVAMSANLAVGRLTFALGVAVGLTVLVAVRHGRFRLAALGAVLTPLASPVAAAFLALALVAWTLPHLRWPLADSPRPDRVRAGLGLVAATLAPILVLAVVFPSGGTFPFARPGFVLAMVVCLGLVVALPADEPVLRTGALLAAVACAAAFVLPTPMGGNAVRLPMFFALPVLLVGVVRARREVLLALSALLIAWAWQPALDAVTGAPGDPSVDAAFYAPLLRVLAEQEGPPGRLEIPPTRRHWETVHMAATVPLARGWERQLDRRLAPLFYEEGLDPLTYRAWLVDNGVRHVAVADGELGRAAEAGVALIDRGLAYLRPVWEGSGWRVFEVIDHTTLVSGAELVRLGIDEIELEFAAPGDAVVRIRQSPLWDAEGDACVVSDGDPDWLVVRAPAAGSVTVRMALDVTGGLTGGGVDPCPVDPG